MSDLNRKREALERDADPVKRSEGGRSEDRGRTKDGEAIEHEAEEIQDEIRRNRQARY